MYKVINIITEENTASLRYRTFFKNVEPDFDIHGYTSDMGYVKKNLTLDELVQVIKDDGWTQAHSWNGFNIKTASYKLDESTVEMVDVYFHEGRITRIDQEDYNRFNVWSRG